MSTASKAAISSTWRLSNLAMFEILALPTSRDVLILNCPLPGVACALPVDGCSRLSRTTTAPALRFLYFRTQSPGDS